MKFVLGLFAFFSVNVFAAPTPTPAPAPIDICSSFMKCGTYLADEVDKDGNKYQTKITITATGPMTATFDYTYIETDGTENVWPLTVQFSEDGSAIMRYKGQFTYAVSLCKHNMCNYALVPFEDGGKIWGNAGLMRFTNDTLEFLMFVGSPTNYRDSATVLKKQ